MDSLPFETLEHIFELACVDGGHTGCSLSLTSKAIRAASRTTRFYSVALDLRIPADHTPGLLRVFLSLYEQHSQTTCGDRSRIRHLHMTLTAATLSRGLSDVHALFQAVSGDIYTLLLDLSTCNPLTMLPEDVRLDAFDSPFPSLRELTVLGVTSPHIIVAPHSALKEPLFPALQRLHIIDHWHRAAGAITPPSPKFDEWMAHVPRATHLRISNLHWASIRFIERLTESMGYSDSEVERAARLPSVQALRHPHLKYVAVQLCALPSPRSGGGYSIQVHSLFSRYLEVLISGYPKDPGLQMALVPSPTVGSESVPGIDEVARRQWVDRIEGRPGCWSVFKGGGDEQ
ncbi:hypothetical protein BC628DRAFT_364598 [Trametes gibbosa]|nr:hypothetical protein BC628DRAFT_364598 [Trametes gibbosa]